MSDRIAVMNRGRIEQYDARIRSTPAGDGLRARVRRPVDAHPGKVSDFDPAGWVTVDTPHGPLRGRGKFQPGADVLVGVRPERMAFGARAGWNVIRPVLTDIVFQGARIQAHFDAPEDLPLLVETTGELPEGLSGGAPTAIAFSPEDTMVFPLKAAA